MDVMSAVVTLFLVMDPLGNVPLFLSILKAVEPTRRRVVLVREIFFAYENASSEPVATTPPLVACMRSNVMRRGVSAL